MKNHRKKFLGFCLILLAGLILTGPAWGSLGDPLWETEFDYRTAYDPTFINSMAVSSTSLIVCGSANPASGTGTQLGYIKAFDINTGTPKWEKILTLGANGNGFGGLIVNGDVVVVSGNANTVTPTMPITYTLSKKLLQAYNADTGYLLWEDINDFENFRYQSTGPAPESKVVSNNRVFTAVQKFDTSGNWVGTWILRAYQLKSVMPPTQLLLE